tara:strand:- start:534 stop:830 length:297 start_codon:yes stop_codon:yes gene_type:complete
MKRQQIYELLESLYADAIEPESAWQTYQNFYHICTDGDKDTMDYMYNVIDMSATQRLELRRKMAERGFELTPSQLNQYIFLLLLATMDYIDDRRNEYT